MKFIETDDQGNEVVKWKDVSSGIAGKDPETGKPMPAEGKNPRSAPKGKLGQGAPAQKV